MTYFERNPYDISSIERLFDIELISQCIRESDNHTYEVNPNWQKSLEKECFSDPIDSSHGNNSMKRFDIKVAKSILNEVRKLVNRQNVVASGHFIYPPTGYMGWHTNFKYPCKRLYITYASEDKKSFFRYRDPETGEIITDYDDKGITIRQFYVSRKPPYFWHCVGSDCIRISLGYRINPPLCY